jgi:hypothetical protein
VNTAVICEGCGRAAGAREVYCPACGRQLPGREVPGGSDAAPPGWLVAAGARGEGGYFEPLPSVPVSVADPLAPARDNGQAWRLRDAPAKPAAPLPPPPALQTAAETPVEAPALVVTARRPPLRVLYVPLLALVVLSSGGAVTLLVLHALLHR